MEKRVLLAFALSMAVFFVWMQFFAPKPPPRSQSAAPAPVTAATEAPAAVTATVAAAPAAAPRMAMPAPATQETLVTLDGALVDATFSTTRSLTGWVLENYRVTPPKDSKHVDLAEAPLDLALLSDGAAPAFAVASRATDAVQFVGRAGALAETRHWKLDGYVATLTWSARNEGDRAVVVHPTARMHSRIDYKHMSSYEKHGPVISTGEKVEHPDDDDVAAKAAFRNVKWAGFGDKYFIRAVLPPDDMREVGALVEAAAKQGEVTEVELRVDLPSQTLAPGAEYTTTLRVYYGPKLAANLAAVGSGLSQSIDYGFFSVLARPLLALLKVFHNGVGNYGVAIILLTVLIKLLFYPLTRKSFTSMRDMQRIQPKLEALKKKYEKDRDRLNREMMNLYRTEGINPLGGCLPMVLQIPVFFALYQVLLNSIELRHAPLALWVNDLSAPEHLFSLHLAGFELPFRLLPLVMGVTMVLQQKLTPSTMDKAQQQIMMIMPVMFTFMFWGFPSGLVLYWLVNNVISIAQQWWITRDVKAAA